MHFESMETSCTVHVLLMISHISGFAMHFAQKMALFIISSEAVLLLKYKYISDMKMLPIAMLHAF